MPKFNQFHLGDNLSYKSGGLFVSFEKTVEEIKERKEKVVKILEKYSGIELTETKDGILIDDFGCWESRKKRITLLLEENSILGDALFYLSSKIMKKWSCIDDITDEIEQISFKRGLPNFSHYYNFVDIIIGDIVKDLEETIENGFVFNNEEDYISVGELIATWRDFLDPINGLKQPDEIIYS